MRVWRPSLWPAVIVTLMTGAGFAGLKFVLIGELAFEYSPKDPLIFEWMDRLVRRCVEKGTLEEAVSQGLAAVLTLGVLVGYLINAPLAGAWRCSRLFVASSAGVAVGSVATLWFNPWIVAGFVGIAYGAACAARGKVIPLLARSTMRPNTQVSGIVNSCLVVGILTGTVLGTILREKLSLETHRDSIMARHAIIFAFMCVATGLALLVRPPEPRPITFGVGMRELLGGTASMMRRHWALLAAGGMAWGIASAASLAVYIDAIDDTRLDLTPTRASSMALFAAIGAIGGNLASHWFTLRRQVMSAYFALAVCIAIYPHVVHTHVTASIMMVLVGAFFAAPTNVMDARLLALAAAEGHHGRGSTVMSLVHNIFIFLVGFGLAVPLFLGVMSATQQFYVLAGITLLTMIVSSRARLRDHGTMVRIPGGDGVAIASGID